MARRKTTEVKMTVTFPEGVTEAQVRDALQKAALPLGLYGGAAEVQVRWPPRPVVKESIPFETAPPEEDE